ncbi:MULTISPECIES: 16S rRNA pseudouridine(516) synthase [unclassified Streptococcus]|uniref:16S rRNA pseudouridine(516) synthase n=1 Tax=unclassified Streptococcus TaxID=2608887 RepID=UPI001072564A|nr:MULTISPECIES: 16S rRNA pseudouridine(516) synthase [unclassified Streptococcus]MBF0787953.1 16S rRNA pseudouridine(516) synthase [Streptococcus sp. 19428wC2_LYSM12]MCQ9210984.1 16S rRNA pseudouridine(516) synthase [Streptococcus sp. B01]MCQ9214255.1 16S rRNA pseudouridine(516) synthase [Streptococcus sp. O1]TFV05004.1 16S rRNA pseudouridine(516) synthase [Streptococcus sp. LYSM12]
MRLDKCLEKAGWGSRNQIKKLLKAQQVTVDGRPARTGNQIVDPGLQVIEARGKQVELESPVYYLLNKPAGVVSAVSDAKHETVIDIIAKNDRRVGLYPVGRLDRDTEGLLLITNNGPLGFRMLHPKYHVDKIYYVEVNGILAADAVAFFQEGIRFLDGTICQPARLEILSAEPTASCARVQIEEGKFHQVKKMFLAYGVKVTYLKRLSFGGFVLEDDLPVGAYRGLTCEEKEILKQYLD